MGADLLARDFVQGHVMALVKVLAEAHARATVPEVTKEQPVPQIIKMRGRVALLGLDGARDLVKQSAKVPAKMLVVALLVKIIALVDVTQRAMEHVEQLEWELVPEDHATLAKMLVANLAE